MAGVGVAPCKGYSPVAAEVLHLRCRWLGRERWRFVSRLVRKNKDTRLVGGQRQGNALLAGGAGAGKNSTGVRVPGLQGWSGGAEADSRIDRFIRRIGDEVDIAVCELAVEEAEAGGLAGGVEV